MDPDNIFANTVVDIIFITKSDTSTDLENNPNPDYFEIHIFIKKMYMICFSI
jgi:hypothetical protein